MRFDVDELPSQCSRSRRELTCQPAIAREYGIAAPRQRQSKAAVVVAGGGRNHLHEASRKALGVDAGFAAVEAAGGGGTERVHRGRRLSGSKASAQRFFMLSRNAA